jgi:sulfite exporter TauE/SafE
LSDHLISSINELRNFFPFVSFIAGLSGSLHCVGMCGGLVTATCARTKDVFSYQTGRLIGYLTLGAFGGFFGGFLSFKTIHPYWSLIPALFLASVFIFWGFSHLKGKKAEIPTPKFLRRLYFHLWNGLVKNHEGFNRAMITGLISIFLPCGLLYGVVLATLSLEHSYEALFSMLFFWLGTLPAMMAAPSFIRKLINPLQRRLPKIFGVGLILIGLMTLSLRVLKAYDNTRLIEAGASLEALNCH